MAQKSIRLRQRQDVRKILSRAKQNNQTGARFLRTRGTNQAGEEFSGLQKATVWLNASIIPGKDIALWRQDPCGAYMYWHDYGKRSSRWGWEVDHVIPVAKGGTDSVTNLQALHWQNNRHKADDVGTNYCVVTGRKA